MTQQKIQIKKLPITIRFSYKCKICGLIFDYKSVIRDHLFKDHNISSEIIPTIQTKSDPL